MGVVLTFARPWTTTKPFFSLGRRVKSTWHCPVFLYSISALLALPKRTKRWKLEDSSLHESTCELHLHEMQDVSADEACDLIISRLLEAEKVALPGLSGRFRGRIPIA